MKPLVKNLAAVIILGSTSALLVADSAANCHNKAEDTTFAVSGDCGPSGTLRIEISEDRCSFFVENAEALNLPPNGDTTAMPGKLERGGWRLYDSHARTDFDGGVSGSDGGPSAVPSVTYECLSIREDNLLKLRCEERTDELPPQVLRRCEAVLTEQ